MMKINHLVVDTFHFSLVNTSILLNYNNPLITIEVAYNCVHVRPKKKSCSFSETLP